MSVSPAKMAEPIKMLFGRQTQVGPRNQVLGGGALILQREVANFAAVRPLKSTRRLCCGACKNGWINRDSVWWAYSRGPEQPCIILGQGRTNPFIAMRGDKSAIFSLTRVSCAKTGELMAMPLRRLSHMGKEACIKWRSRSDESMHCWEKWQDSFWLLVPVSNTSQEECLQ